MASLMARMTAPEGTGFEASREYMGRVTDKLTPLIESGEVQHVLAMTPGWGGGSGVNSGIGIVDLAPWEERDRTAAQIARELSGELSSVTGVRVFIFQPSGLSFYFGQPVQFVIGGPTYEELARWRDIILEKAKSYPGLTGVDADYRETTPQFRVAIDRDRAAELGVTFPDDRTHAGDDARLAPGHDVRGQGRGVQRGSAGRRGGTPHAVGPREHLRPLRPNG